MSDTSARHLFPMKFIERPSADVELVRDFTHGRQWGVDKVRFGVSYVFSRSSTAAFWVIHAGPFTDESVAKSWIARLQ